MGPVEKKTKKVLYTIYDSAVDIDSCHTAG